MFGAATDTWNLGVSALAHSTLAAVAGARPGCRLVVFDNGLGHRDTTLAVGPDRLPVELRGARHSRRLHRGDTLRTIRAAGLAGGLGNGVIATIREATAVLDLSGGDSFTDLYGSERLAQILLHKRITLSQDTPLVLLPQTYGPFTHRRSRRAARAVVRRASQAWARDEPSFGRLARLLGDELDPTRHRLGVDVAFGLPATPPDGPLPAPIDAWLAPGRSAPVVGLNVSGLVHLHGDPAGAFGLATDYRALVDGLVRVLLDRTDARILLIPHVLAPPGHHQSDREASERVLAGLDRRDAERVRVLATPRSPSAAKWLISRVDWFCGTRMHAAIAALSTATPACAIAYSVKTKGVFATCGQADHVADATTLTTQDALDLALWSFANRDAARAGLATRAPEVNRAAVDQVGEMLAALDRGARVAAVGS